METLLPDGTLPPSVTSGACTLAEESSYRVFGAQLIAEMGMLLRLPNVATVTAQALLQRFLYRASLREVDVHHVALAAVFLATKLEECSTATTQMRDVVNVCHALRARRLGREPRPLVLGGALYMRWKEALILTERRILKELGFQVYAGVCRTHAHKFLLYFVRLLGGPAELAQAAWSHLNDSLHLDLCVRHPPEAIACAAIYLAARRTGFALPQHVPWSEVLGAPLREVEGIAAAILELYDAGRANPQWLPSLREGHVEGEDDE